MKENFSHTLFKELFKKKNRTHHFGAFSHDISDFFMCSFAMKMETTNEVTICGYHPLSTDSSMCPHAFGKSICKICAMVGA